MQIGAMMKRSLRKAVEFQTLWFWYHLAAAAKTAEPFRDIGPLVCFTLLPLDGAKLRACDSFSSHALSNLF